MRKRYCENTLMKNRKKKGSSILIRAVILMIGCGMLSGCSMAEEDTGSEDAIKEDTENASGAEAEEDQTEQVPVDDHSDRGDILEETIMLAFMKGGEQEQKKAVLTAGDGYYVYLPENEWQPSGSDLWTASVNGQVQLWITHFEAESMNSVDQKLENDGYEAEQGFHKWKQEGDIIYHVELKEAENDVWGVFYCYPTDAEEGWGREVSVIADTFAVSA